MEKISPFILRSTQKALNLKGYRSRYIEMEHGSFHYYEAKGLGKLLPMVFIHGLSSNAGDLAPLFQRLRRHSRKIIVLDLPVHGFSHMPIDKINIENINQMFYLGLDQILEKEEPALIFGNSLGGMAAIRYANHNQDNVAMMVLASPGGARIPIQDLEDLFQFFREHTLEKPGLFVDKIFDKPPFYRKWIEKEVQFRFSRPEMQAYMAQFDPTDHLQPEELKNIQVPTLMIWGKQDRILENHVDFHREHIPDNFRLEEPEHFTHSPFLEGNMSIEMANKILHWAQRHS